MDNKDIFKKNIIFQLKGLGVNGLCPIILGILALILIIGQMDEPHKWIQIIKISEMLIPMTAGWVSIFLFYDLLQEQGYEIFFTYPIKKSKLGVKKVLGFYIIYAVSLVAYVLIVQLMTKENIFLSLYMQLFIEGIFFLALGFIAITFTMNAAFSIVILVCYNIINILTVGKHLKVLNIFYFNAEVLPLGQVFIMGIKPIVYAIILIIIGQIRFKSIGKK